MNPLVAMFVAGSASSVFFFMVNFGLGTQYDCPEQAGSTTCNILNRHFVAYGVALGLLTFLVGWLVAKKGRTGWVLLGASPIILVASMFFMYNSSQFFVDRANASQEKRVKQGH